PPHPRHPLFPYTTLFRSLRALRRTVLEEQPPRAREVRGRPAHDLAEARERFQAGSERRPRLMGHSRRRHGRIVRGDVGRVADDEIEALTRERLIPVAPAE